MNPSLFHHRPLLLLVLLLLSAPAGFLAAGGGREEPPPSNSGIRVTDGGPLEPGAAVSATGVLGVYGNEADRFLALRLAAPAGADRDIWLMELIVTDRLRATLDRYQGRTIEVGGTLESLPAGRRRGAIRVELLRSLPQ